MTTPADDACSCELGSLRGLAPYLNPRRYRPGQVLWAEGQAAGRLVILDAGRIKAVRASAEGRTVLLYVFGPGNVFGLLPFVDQSAAPATAIAVEAVRTREISYPALREAIRREPEVAMALLGVLGRRLREAMARAEATSHHGAVARVAAALLLLVPREAPRPLVLDIPRPRYAFAADLDLTAESFSRALSRLVKAGVLRRLGGSRVQVLDPAALEAAASGHGLGAMRLSGSPPR